MGRTTFYLLEQEQKQKKTVSRKSGKEARKEKNKDEVNITDLTVDEGVVLIKETNDIDKIMKWLADESQGKKRKTLIEPLEERMVELEDNNENEPPEGEK
ncbi:MAG: hypothetical protein FH762_19705 [Firmicutes bacterium]|nr:hypothetical protein [Bacillota bacterium]